MNSTIKRLLAQSGLQAYYDAQNGGIERFAELIVKECANICEHQGRAGWNDDRKAQARLDRDLIKEHFGVQE